ncbi:MAG: glycerophosphodiester phosphodiesterase [Limnochordia bacterium]|jgi:glycerophosphoryl diester phosphodiesterase
MAAKRFCVLGHRGAMGHAPENTMASFAKAIELKTDMTELDVHLSRDGELIVIHDPGVERTTDGEGLVCELTLAQIRSLDAGSWFAPEFAGERVPVLSEVMELVKGKIDLNVEVKAGPKGIYPGIIDRLIDEIERHDMVDSVVVSSFQRPYLHELRQKAPHVKAALLYSKAFDEPWQQAVDQGWDLHPHMSLVDPRLVDEAHARGISVRAWNPNKAEEMRPLIALGVDGVGTNYPEILQRVWREYHAERGTLP